MVLMHEWLSGMGVNLHDDDYSSMILMSLPESCTLHLKTLANAASSSGNPLTAHTFITKVIDLYEKCQLCTRHDTKLGSRDVAFQTQNSKNREKKGGRKPKKNVECFNCRKKGHFSCDCYRPSGSKEGQGPHSKKDGHKPKEGSANMANNTPDGAWSTITPIASCKANAIYNNDIYLEELDGLAGPDVPLTLIEPTDIDTAHVAQPDPSAHSHAPELYNSGATCHITPLKDSLTNYQVISPGPIGAANQHTFDAIGCGNLTILIPNGNTNTRILLRDVLHTQMSP